VASSVRTTLRIAIPTADDCAALHLAMEQVPLREVGGERLDRSGVRYRRGVLCENARLNAGEALYRVLSLPTSVAAVSNAIATSNVQFRECGRSAHTPAHA